MKNEELRVLKGFYIQKIDLIDEELKDFKSIEKIDNIIDQLIEKRITLEIAKNMFLDHMNFKMKLKVQNEYRTFISELEEIISK